MTQAVEQVFVQIFVPHTSIEAFDEAILHRLARSDIVLVDLAVFLLLLDRVTGQLGSINADHHAWVAAHFGNPIQLTTHAVT